MDFTFIPITLPSQFIIAELDALEADMGMETEADGVPSYLQPDKEPDLDAELNLPSAPMGHAAGRSNVHVCVLFFLNANKKKTLGSSNHFFRVNSLVVTFF